MILRKIFFLVFLTALSLGQAHADDDVEKTGDILRAIIPLTALGTTVFYEDGSEGAKQFIRSFIATEVITLGLKHITHRRRPNGECCTSFPSGHTSKAFMGAAFIQKRYGGYYAIPAWLGAAFVGYSRVHANKHHVTDVIAGAAIGILSSYYFTKPYQGFSVTPYAGKGFYGFMMSKRW